MSVIDLVEQSLGDSQIKQLSSQIGADPTQTRSAIQAAVPMLLAGMSNTAQQPQGAVAIQDAIQAHEGLASHLDGLFTGAPMGDAGGILSRVLGGQSASVHNGVQQSSGLSSDQTKRLLMMLAPLVLTMLAKRRLAPNAQPIGAHVQQEAQQAQARAQQKKPELGGILGSILGAVESR